MASQKTMLRLRAESAREYSYHPDARRIYKDGFTQGWKERDKLGAVLPMKVAYVPPLAPTDTVAAGAKPLSVMFAWMLKHGTHAARFLTVGDGTPHVSVRFRCFTCKPGRGSRQ